MIQSHMIEGESEGAAFVEEVRELAEGRIEHALSPVIPGGLAGACGKLLRTRFAARLMDPRCAPRRREALAYVCAATEIVHTASLLHDDIIDGGLMRRGQPSLWCNAGVPAAILLGDLLLCEALALLTRSGVSRQVPLFVAKVREVVVAEARQELSWRGRQPDRETLLALARGKTGPLFAFVARACGSSSAERAALEEAGYLVGTSYQLADDMLDLSGCGEKAGKTLGTDAIRGKPTLARQEHGATRVTSGCIARLCASALECLDPYPARRGGLADFLAADLAIFSNHLGRLPAASKGISA